MTYGAAASFRAAKTCLTSKGLKLGPKWPAAEIPVLAESTLNPLGMAKPASSTNSAISFASFPNSSAWAQSRGKMASRGESGAEPVELYPP